MVQAKFNITVELGDPHVPIETVRNTIAALLETAGGSDVEIETWVLRPAEWQRAGDYPGTVVDGDVAKRQFCYACVREITDDDVAISAEHGRVYHARCYDESDAS